LISTDKRKSSDYKVGYSFHLTENQFCIEFYTKEGLRLEKETQLHLMDKFKALDKNLNNYRFYRRCNGCRRYHYSSVMFRLNFETASLNLLDEDFIIDSEYFSFIQAMEQGSKMPYRIYRLLNCYSSKKEAISYLTYWNSPVPHGTLSDSTIPSDANFLDLPLIPFVSLNDTLQRIQKLLVFS